jgi:hypothetical protein
MTVRENLLPSAMVPGLVTIEDKDGNRQNVHPIDAKELIRSGDYTLVENGAVEAARIAATPLRSGMAAGIPDDMVVTEVSGIAGAVVTASPDEAQAIKDAGADIDGKTADTAKAPTTGAPAPKPTAPAKTEAKADDKK